MRKVEIPTSQASISTAGASQRDAGPGPCLGLYLSDLKRKAAWELRPSKLAYQLDEELNIYASILAHWRTNINVLMDKQNFTECISHENKTDLFQNYNH